MNPARIVGILFILQISGYPVVMAQRYLTTFGTVTTLRVDSSTGGILGADFDADGREDIAAYGSTGVACFLSDTGTAVFRRAVWHSPQPLKKAAAARCNQDRLTDLVAITGADQSTIQVLLARGKGRFTASWTYHNDRPVEQFLLADLDGDHRTDIVVFGKKQLGLTVFRGQGNGTFRPPQQLLGDYSFGSLLVTSLRDNGILDIVGANWILNEVLVFPGFGKMKYSDPLVIRCSSEPTMLQTAYLDTDAHVELVAGFVDPPALRIFSGDGLGEFHPAQEIALNRAIADLAVADVNGDGRDDLVLLPQGARDLEIMLNNGEGTLLEKISYAAGQTPSQFIPFRHPTASYAGAAILDSSQSLVRVLWSARVAAPARGERSYGVGEQPAAVLAVDLHRNGWKDLVVANTGSNAISLLLNNARGVLGGQISFALKTAPATLRYVAKNDSTAIVASTSAAAGIISLLELNLRTLSHATYTLPVQGDAEVLSAAMDSTHRYLHLVSLERDKATHGTAFIEFEQVGATRFVERLHAIPSFPSIFCATMGDANGDGMRDLSYCVPAGAGSTWELWQSLSRGNFQFGLPRHLYSFPDAGGSPTAIVSGDLNDDGRDDLLLAVPGPESSLFALLAQADSGVQAPIALPGRIEIAGADRVQLADMNCDGENDVILENSLTDAIEVYLGEGGGAFAAGVTLYRHAGIGGFALTDLDNDNVPDLVVTNAESGLLEIVPQGRYACR